ncbi:PRMT5 arginine-N-methyltransferase-domain-containing protein [Fimicolochytrium jonesii]|uniref:PRMT5 arginine-N-methyltransferase-domain-containing protein n=1 Tax=Fimicolochytrium jonesii TaxID=1396493 RepID=UPI0022FE48A6|nr:PRMT5 arginine-N-methyltransferase-domain-containing protein [Fimicolochytrium jonesii]KAI8816455.1 PRMT5 arginine-N-methyltransferase-domain-containing protein [Fimicolochytrium jonesii]
MFNEGTDKATVGLELRSATDPALVTDVSNACGFSFGLINLLRAGVQDRFLTDTTTTTVPNAFQPADLQLTDPAFAGNLVGGISPCEPLDSPDAVVRQKCEQLIRQQIQWAAHLGLSAVLFTYPETQNSSNANFARVVNRALGMVTYTQIWVKITVEGDGRRAWGQWNMLRTFCQHSPKLLVVLQIGAHMPDADTMKQWVAEPVRVVMLPTTAFLANKKGFPVLSKAHQSFLHSLMEQNVQFIVSADNEGSQAHTGGPAAYQQYLSHLHRTRPEQDIVDQFATGYHDYLQSPLQPLMDNLESATYEVFEKDPIKYQEYERATYRALLDRVPEGSDTVTVVMVVGAGRGPLVQRALQAAENAKRRVKVYAVEKNPNAIVTLRARKQTEWGDLVEVVHCDMRYWTAPEQTDILISELLGSFGDNELSPECLDGAQRFLKPDGISIPSDYTAFIAPISSTKLFNEVASFKDTEHMETPYVVKFRAINELASPKPVWTFTHPNRNLKLDLGSPAFNAHNNRYSTQRFRVSSDSLMHGVAGYFEATLYKDVMISIHPATHSPGMFSWFPIFFPIKEPVYLRKGGEVEVCFWRCGDARKVWYEWCVVPVAEEGEVPVAASSVHNVDGRSSWIGL